MSRLPPFVIIMAALALPALVACRGRRSRDQEPADTADAAAPKEPPVAARVTAADVADARRKTWLDGPLTGRDNNVAAYRAAKITRDEKLGFRAFVKNEFGLTCGLAFDDEGNPSEITGCKGDDGWHAKDAKIKLTCDEGTPAKGQNCHGKYTLADSSGFADPAVIEIVRPVKGAAP